MSNLSFLSKLAVRAVSRQLLEHAECHNLMPVYQSAYKPGHCTETALVKLHSDICLAMDRQEVTLLVMTDLSAAFDTVDHQILLELLDNRFGIRGSALEWLQSYLANRTQCVQVNGKTSPSVSLKFGVPQGSVLGPLLFTMYTAPLFDIIEAHLQHISAYADDNTLYQHFKAPTEMDSVDAISCMEECLTDVKHWMHKNMLKMNDSKTEFMLVGTSKQLSKMHVKSIAIGDDIIKVADCVKNLGADLDKHLTMSTHVANKSRKAFSQLYGIWQSRKFLTRQAAECLVHSLVFTQLDYCNALLVGVPKYLVTKLQSIQNFAARTVLQKSKFTRVTPLLIELHWLPVEYRIKFKILLLTYKGLNHDTSPAYIKELLVIKPSGNLRSDMVPTLIVPRVKHKTLGERSFARAATTM